MHERMVFRKEPFRFLGWEGGRHNLPPLQKFILNFLTKIELDEKNSG